MTTATTQIPAVGDSAPAFDLPATRIGRARSADLIGSPLVLYFYPRDDTSGCTKEALTFHEMRREFSALGAAVLGVSRDTLASHDRFSAKYGLELPLASDVDGVVCGAYGVWVEKKLYGRVSMGVERATFLINQAGAIHRIWRKVKVDGHGLDVLASVKTLRSEA